jgi:hypothetical protein
MASLEYTAQSPYYTAQSPYNVTPAPVQPAMPQVANNDFLQTIPFGLRSNTWRTQDADVAKSLAKNGVDAISIYQQTGTWLSSDGKWRQEVAKGGQFPQGAGKAGVYKLPADYNVKGPVDNIAEAAKAQYAKGALSALLNNPKQSIGDAVKDVKNLFNPEYMKNVQGMSNEEVTNLALDANPVMGAITTFHGSPYKFDKFDIGQIKGSASNGQAYGWGHYLAEKDNVAKGYQPRDPKYENKLGILYNQAEKQQNYPAMEIYERYMSHETPDDILKMLRDPENLAGYSTKDIKSMEQAHNLASKEYKKQKSSLYKVDLPDEYLPKMLLWDKPLSEHPIEVQQALQPIIAQTKKSFPNLVDDPSGGSLYQLYSQHRGGNPATASQALSEIGIPGVKYFDDFSGGSGSGTHNYVIFDDSIPKILERNSQPVK